MLLGADPSDNQARYGEQAKAATLARIPEIQKELKSLTVEAKQGSGAVTKDVKRARAEKIKALQSELKALKAGKPAVPRLAMPFTVGQIGTPPNRDTEVFQIVGPNEMLVEIVTWTPTFRATQSRVATRPIEGPPEEHRHMVMVRGVETKAVADHQAYPLPELMEVVGYHTYEAVDGSSKTVMVLVPFKVDKADAAK
jgi:hypothetical protein